jgi:hypothetical protein
MLAATATGHSDASPSTDEADAGGDIALHDEAFPAAMISGTQLACVTPVLAVV